MGTHDGESSAKCCWWFFPPNYRKVRLDFRKFNEDKSTIYLLSALSFIVPHEIFEKFECVIFHMTDLPYGRGGSPLQNLILRGHRDTVICAIQCIGEVDAGPIYLRRNLSLAGSAQEIFLRASEKIHEMILEIIESEPNPEEQLGPSVVFQRRKSEESQLRDLHSLEELYDFIRMLDADGYPRAFLNFENLRFEFRDAVLDGGSVVASVLITDLTKN